jgi:peptidoglycan/xylan/chitin deacetylase (PgdA/CDA1 family)
LDTTVTALAAKVVRPRLRVVLYHHVAERTTSLVDQLGVTTAPDVFEAHVRRLARDYQVVGLDEVLSGSLPRRALLITFDDGYRSVAEVALPILKRLGLPSVYFVTEECLQRHALPLDNLLSHLCAGVAVDRLGAALDVNGPPADAFPQLLDLIAAMPYRRRLAIGDELAERFEVDQQAVRAASGLFLDPEDLAGLAAAGCEVANHGRTHLFYRSITDEESAHHELVEHAAWLASLAGRPMRAFSYPYGRRRDATPLVERVLRESGHEATFLAEARPHLTGSRGRLWNRVTLDGCPAWRVGAEVEVAPTLRAWRDRAREGRGPHTHIGDQGPKIASSEYDRSPAGGGSGPLK